jgi:hypothetical protein
MFRVLLGLIKGGIVGVAVGYGAQRAGLGVGGSAWLVYGAVGFLAGIVCGKPPWRQETMWTSIIKGVIGFGVCTGLYWVAGKTLGAMDVPGAVTEVLGIAGGKKLMVVPAALAPIIGVVYGVFVEVDDGGKAKNGKSGGGKKLS